MRWINWLFAAGFVAILPLHGQVAGGSIDVPAGAHVLLQARGDGAQVYRCASGADGLKWTLLGPDAKLLNADGEQIGRHFTGPTWKLTDGSAVQGELMASQPSPDAGSVAWLLLRAKAGSASGQLATVAYIRRTDTKGGVADKAACHDSAQAGKIVRAHYTATYTFYSEK
ncbi:MAG: DUF3455 domain-containing protein [Acidobacteriaceae bacterium]